jgi:hypothetical protein
VYRGVAHSNTERMANLFTQGPSHSHTALTDVLEDFGKNFLKLAYVLEEASEVFAESIF